MVGAEPERPLSAFAGRIGLVPATLQIGLALISRKSSTVEFAIMPQANVLPQKDQGHA